MTTFLEFVCTRMFGPPTARKGGGESYWKCPRCRKEGKFHTRPHDPAYKDRFGCFACGTFGDEFDALRLAMPGCRYPQQQAILADLRAEYDALPPEQATDNTTTAIATTTAVTSSPPGTGTVRSRRAEREVATAWADLTPDESRVLAAACEIARRAGVPLEALAVYAHDFHSWLVASDLEHLRGCDDPECDAVVCRAARGLPPLTPEQLAADKAERDALEAAARARILQGIRANLKRMSQRRSRNGKPRA